MRYLLTVTLSEGDETINLWVDGEMQARIGLGLLLNSQGVKQVSLHDAKRTPYKLLVMQTNKED